MSLGLWFLLVVGFIAYACVYVFNGDDGWGSFWKRVGVVMMWGVALVVCAVLGGLLR